MLANCALICCICRISSSRSCIRVGGSSSGVVVAGILEAVGATATAAVAEGMVRELVAAVEVWAASRNVAGAGGGTAAGAEFLTAASFD